MNVYNITFTFFFVIFFFFLTNTTLLSSARKLKWDASENLYGCQKGDRRPGIGAIKHHLNHFGYIPSAAEFTDDFDDDLEKAILTYQNNFHLNATGILDLATMDELSRPRCGVPDIINGANVTVRGRNLYTYFEGQPRWNKRELTYAFSSTPDVPIPPPVLQKVYVRAFARWSEVSQFSFSESQSDTEADVNIGFFRGDHGDGSPFDGPGHVLAHAFRPADGRLHVDADETWVASAQDGSPPELSQLNFDLESVVVHEIGHVLGLGHTNIEEAIMYPAIGSGTRKVKLSQDDIDGIQNLYM